MLKNLSIALPESLTKLCMFLVENEVSLTLVGGSVRDYLISRTLSKDLDIEYRSTLSTKEIFDLIKKHLGDDICIEELKFDIIRIILADFEVELSRARVEIYKTNTDDAFGHSDFKAKYDSKLEYIESFKRRDLTINAIGIKYNLKNGFNETVDPYNGSLDIKNKLLSHINENFFKDPVRFVRLIRFHLQTQYTISNELNCRLHFFNLDKLSCYYFFKEAFKCDILKFMNIYFHLIERSNISYNTGYDILKKFLDKKNVYDIKCSEDLYFFAIINCNFDIDDCDKLIEILPLKKKIIKNIFELRKIRQSETFKNLHFINKLNIEDISESSQLQNLYKLSKLFEKLDINKDNFYTQEFIDQLIAGNEKKALISNTQLNKFKIDRQFFPLLRIYLSFK